MKQRLDYIDVAKGLLILLVVCHHIPYEAQNTFFVSSTSWMFKVQPLYVSFFMPAFFILTGYCSHFSSNFLLFLRKNLKSLILPAFIFYMLNEIYHWVLFEQEIDVYRSLFIFAKSGGAWFVPALFLSKIAYWCIRNIFQKEKMIWIVLLSIMIVGTYFYTKFNEYWYMWHAASLMIFIKIGEKIKTCEINAGIARLCSIVYLLVLLVCLLVYGDIPRVSYSSMIKVIYLIPFGILAVSATVSLLYVAKYWEHNKILKFFGKNSLMVYLIHNSILATCFLALPKFGDLPIVVLKLGIPFLAFVITLFACALVIKLFNLPYLKCCLGKF